MDQAAVVTHAMNEDENADRSAAIGVDDGAVTDAVTTAGSGGSSPPPS